MVIKIIRRVFAAIVVLTISVGIISESFRYTINNNQVVGSIIVGSCMLGILFIWGYVFYHWGTNQFRSKGYKIFWFIFILLGLYAGAFLYYILAVELHLSLRKKELVA
jgi:hypothetical protein